MGVTVIVDSLNNKLKVRLYLFTLHSDGPTIIHLYVGETGSYPVTGVIFPQSIAF